MNMTTAVKTCLSKYVTFSGRAQRSEYWWWTLAVVVLSILLTILDGIIAPTNELQPLSSLFSLVIFLPGLAVSVRRMHDLDRSGWWILLWLIPLIGWIIVIYWFAQKGTNGENRFGSDPLMNVGDVFE